jgi:hypothetical protein
MLGQSKPLTCNITRKKCMLLKSVKVNKEIRILQAGKGNYKAVLSESTCKRLSSLLESGVYEHLQKDPMSQIERKLRKRLSKHKTFLSAALKQTDSVPQ